MIYRILVNRRVKKAAQWMREGNLYPRELASFMADYRYAISVTYRNIIQVVNIEESIRYISEQKIPGCIVECGVFTGGASAFALKSLMRNDTGRHRAYFGFDSFEGMPQPTPHDGASAISWMYGAESNRIDPSQIAGVLTGSDVNRADYAACLNYLKGTGYPEHEIHLIKGWFQDALPAHKNEMKPIAILRIDGDFYESTKVCLDTLFDNVAQGGVIILDDYGGFSGSRKAVDEFLMEHNIRPWLHYVDDSIRSFIKP